MKKLVLAVLMLTIASASAFSQAAFGIKGGYKTSLGLDETWSSINFENANIKKDISRGFNAGLFARFGYRVYGQLEVLYSYQKYDYTSIEDNASTTSTFLEHGLEVPVLFGAKLVSTRNFNLRLMVGPTFVFNLTDQSKLPYAEGIQTTKNVVAFGLDCGLGIDVWIFTLDLRYKLVQQSYDYSFESIAINTNPNNAFEVSLGIKFFDYTK